MNIEGKQRFRGHLAVKVIRHPDNMNKLQKLVAAIKRWIEKQAERNTK